MSVSAPLTTAVVNSLPIYAIVAMDQERAIGKEGGLPWHIPEDLKHFSALTKGHTVLMGRKTFDSLPEKFKPLPGRLNLVLSKDLKQLEYPNTKVFNDLNQVIKFCSNSENLFGDKLWVIGGEQIFKLTKDWWSRIYITRVPGMHQGDAFLPEFESNFKLTSEKESENCTFQVYERQS